MCTCTLLNNPRSTAYPLASWKCQKCGSATFTGVQRVSSTICQLFYCSQRTDIFLSQCVHTLSSLDHWWHVHSKKNSAAVTALHPNSNAANRFWCQATELVEVLTPLAHAILCLESLQSTLADVMIFWATACTWYCQLLNDPNFDLDIQSWHMLISIVNHHYSEIINDGPHDAYFACLALHPHWCTDYFTLYASNFWNTGYLWSKN